MDVRSSDRGWQVERQEKVIRPLAAFISTNAQPVAPLVTAASHWADSGATKRLFELKRGALRLVS
jgi:hypothetical protein